MTIWTPGEVPVRPGTYIRTENLGAAPAIGTTAGIVGAVLAASWGPVGASALIASQGALDDTYGTGTGPSIIREALYGGARGVRAIRVGTGGVVATRTLVDTTGAPINAVRIDARYPGTRGNALYLTLRDSLTDAARRELLVYELVAGGYTLRQTITFLKGAGNTEPAGLVAAVTASNSPWITATFLAAGTNVLAAVSLVALISGVNPTVDGAGYVTALQLLELDEWNVAALDTADTAIQASAKAWIDRLWNEGKRRHLVLGEPTSVLFATRQADARAFNDPGISYVINGFSGADLLEREGYLAAARYAGMVAAAPVTRGLNYAPVAGATSLIGGLQSADVKTSITAGAVVFSTDKRGRVVVERGVTTFNQPNASLDAGWSSLRRSRSRADLLNRIDLAWEPLIPLDLPNTKSGWDRYQDVAQGVVNLMIDEGALSQGRVYLDPDRPATGVQAYFKVEVDDNDSIAVLLLTASFRFSAPASAAA